MPILRLVPFALVSALALFGQDAGAAGPPDRHFVIRVQDSATGEPLGCATLTTTHRVVLESDDNGVVAFFEPGLMGQEVFFTVERQGYRYPPDFFGFEGTAVDVEPGGTAVLEMDRIGDPGSCDAGDAQTRLALAGVPAAEERFRIEVVDAATGRGVPLVTVRSPAGEHVTDSAGLVAFHHPDLMDRSVTFEIVARHGYRPAPGFDGPLPLDTVPGGDARLEVERTGDQISERLYRITGGGIYRDSVLLGEEPPLEEPVIDGLVLGQDTIQVAPYRGRLFHVWGDTNEPSYPLGIFKATGATVVPPEAGGLEPEVGMDLDYFVDGDGLARELAPEWSVPNPPGIDDFLATWLGGLSNVPGPGGEERLFADYAMVEGLTAMETGLVAWSDAGEVFHKAVVFGPDDVVNRKGPTYRWSHDGAEYLYSHNTARIPATAEAILDPGAYQAFTAIVEGTLDEIDRDAEGRIVYSWKTDAPIILREDVDDLGLADAEALVGHVVEPDSGERPLVHENGSTFWNDHRRRFVRIILENFGDPSFLGEIWYAEGDTPMGPWVYTRKIATHDEISFYNPLHHPHLDRDGARTIFFEGTYTTLFTSAEPTPRYDYNQILHRLDLDDPRLVLPVPIYRTAAGELVTKDGLRPGSGSPPAPFMAWDRPAPGSVPVWWTGPACGERTLAAGGEPLTPPIFWALPAGGDRPRTAPLVELAADDGRRAWGVAPTAPPAGFRESGAPVARVWENPLAVDLPVGDYLAPLIADAGPDRCLAEEIPGGGADVTLDGSASSHSGGEIEGWRWSWRDADGTPRHDEGETVEIHLPAGLHPVRLEVAGSDGTRSVDWLVVEVEGLALGGRAARR